MAIDSDNGQTSDNGMDSASEYASLGADIDPDATVPRSELRAVIETAQQAETIAADVDDLAAESKASIDRMGTRSPEENLMVADMVSKVGEIEMKMHYLPPQEVGLVQEHVDRAKSQVTKLEGEFRDEDDKLASVLTNAKTDIDSGAQAAKEPTSNPRLSLERGVEALSTSVENVRGTIVAAIDYAATQRRAGVDFMRELSSQIEATYMNRVNNGVQLSPELTDLLNFTRQAAFTTEANANVVTKIDQSRQDMLSSESIRIRDRAVAAVHKLDS